MCIYPSKWLMLTIWYVRNAKNNALLRKKTRQDIPTHNIVIFFFLNGFYNFIFCGLIVNRVLKFGMYIFKIKMENKTVPLNVHRVRLNSFTVGLNEILSFGNGLNNFLIWILINLFSSCWLFVIIIYSILFFLKFVSNIGHGVEYIKQKETAKGKYINWTYIGVNDRKFRVKG